MEFWPKSARHLRRDVFFSNTRYPTRMTRFGHQVLRATICRSGKFQAKEEGEPSASSERSHFDPPFPSKDRPPSSAGLRTRGLGLCAFSYRSPLPGLTETSAQLATFVPTHRCGAAPDLHRIPSFAPCGARSISPWLGEICTDDMVQYRGASRACQTPTNPAPHPGSSSPQNRALLPT